MDASQTPTPDERLPRETSERLYAELQELRTAHAALLAVVQTIHEITADTDPEDYEQWPGGPDEFRSAIWSRCVAALAAAAKGE
jgi:hypothetical protein